MSLQNLAIIFVIIILPISLILTTYVQSQMDTLTLQIKYDEKLRESTYDALKAFQLNTINSDTSDLANSKLRDIEASASTFFTSIATNFNMSGYNKDILQEYVPALVYTMYDGYYIYSPYDNTLDKTKSNQVITNELTGETTLMSDAEILDPSNENAEYHEGERLTGLKPYIYYSCRYKISDDTNFVITYTLDNFITIQGIIGGNWVYDYGYLLDNIDVSGGTVKYRGIEIDKDETISEYVYDPDEDDIKLYEYIKIDGVKYYHDTDHNYWFSILNGTKIRQDSLNPADKSVAIEYYKDAYNFKQRIMNKHWIDADGNSHDDGYDIDTTLRTNKAVNETNTPLMMLDEDGNPTSTFQFGNHEIFDFGSMTDSDGSIEDPNSSFNQHRLAVIRYCIEKNLSIAIANYNNYGSTTKANFQMPKLNEEEWDRIINNISIISFLQGLSIGGKIYNGYSIVTNSKNGEVVQEDSIYVLTDDNVYHKVSELDLGVVGSPAITQCFLNIDFEIKRVITDDLGTTVYYMPQRPSSGLATGSYKSIVNSSSVDSLKDDGGNYYAYIAKKGGILAQKYFTALARERYGMYRTNVNPEPLKEKFGVT